MKDKNEKRKKSTIFRIFIIPLTAIMLIQSIITIGTLVVRRTTRMLEEYSSGMMSRLVENRMVILQNDMNQRWASVCEQEVVMNRLLEQFLEDENQGVEGFLESSELKNQFLEEVFPECVEILQNNFSTGIFVVITGADREEAGEFEGFFIRDSDPTTNPVNYTDLLLERGSKNLSREWNIPLDTSWTTRFHMSGHGRDSFDNFFYEPWRAGENYPDASAADLGYWSMPFHLEKGTADSYEMITYSIPLRLDGKVYGVLGVEISSRSLNDYFPVTELNESQQSGYMLAVRHGDGRYSPMVGKGVLYNLVRSAGDSFWLADTSYDDLFLVEDIQMNKQGIYAVVCPLRIYSNNAPYENTEWALLGLDTEEDLFGMSHRLYIWIVASVLVGLGFGVMGIYILVRHLTSPVQRLMWCISRGKEGLEEFKPSNILEIDALYDVVKDLTDRQKEAENILLEEKERYKVALESSKDIFFSYDFDSRVLDIVNHETMSGQWKCQEFGGGFIDPDFIYEEDRREVMEVMNSTEDRRSVEFRLRWPKDTEFAWVALSGQTVYDIDGRRRKLVGSIRDIQEQKEKEARQRKKNMTDSLTGLYAFSAGMELVGQCRMTGHKGVMIVFCLDQLKETNEKNGIVFGDMVLEEVGNLIRISCQKLTESTGQQTAAFRLNGAEFVMWIGGWSKERAAGFTEDFLNKIEKNFDSDMFGVHMAAGLARGDEGDTVERLIRMARLARILAASGSASKSYMFYEDLPGAKREKLPELQGREINTLDYSEDVSLISVALNLFGKGVDFPAQMMLMIRKIGRYYKASGVLVTVLRADFNSNYLNYQWHRDKEPAAENVRKYREEDKDRFHRWLGETEVRYFSREDSQDSMIRCFLSIEEGQQGVALPMYDNGSYMGNICILDIDPRLAEDSEEYQNLAELGRVVQTQLNQQQHDIASKAKSEFLSRMSHEIRTPMNGIIGMTAIALQPDQSEERIMDCLQKIQSSSNYLLGLINDILDMSKIESGKMRLEAVNFHMPEKLDTIKELIAPQITAKNIDFVRDIQLTHQWYYADSMRISQVLINLLGNAVKFTPDNGRITLTVHEMDLEDQGTRVYFAVQDTGIGIAKEDQERVFRSFEQSSGTNPAKHQGTGLGLSISNRLVQMMGSNIQLHSRLGEGSTFSFAIPLSFGQSEEKEAKEEEISFAGLHVLVVEDNELNAEIAQSLLEVRDFQVDCVYDGAQAVERIKTTEPGTYDVILMDIMMPVMNGLDATRAIRSMDREDCRSIPIVAMSANAFDDDLKKSVECGMKGHLSKPVEVDKLYRTLNQVIRGKGKTK